MKTPEGYLKHDKMTEREFLMEFIEYSRKQGHGSAYDQDALIDPFLAEFHKTYLPVRRWIVKGEAVWTCEHGVKHPNNQDD